MVASTAIIHVDGRALPADPGNNLLHACLSHGLDLPYFCWHPSLGSVGACRQCAVRQYRDEHDQHGQIVMACMTAASDGARICILDDEAIAFRASVIEWLMTNHPHDCPVCEEGGECHLQDMTHMSGHVYRRYRFNKRTHRNQYLGPFVKHEMNRCIACYRCVRFYREYAGGHDLDVFGAHNHVYFGRQSDGVLESDFSGNLVEICPTGVFTDKLFSERYTRKWDLQSAASVCVHCAVGCNTFANARYGELRRIINRYHHQINGYFLCDRGRYGYGFVNADSRIRLPLRGRAPAAMSGPADEPPTLEPVTRTLALEQLALFLHEGAAADTLGIGSPRASLEANFALRTLVGPERFHLGVDDQEARLLATVLRILREAPAASLQDVEAADAALVLGEDVAETAPRLALSLRQMVRQAGFTLAQRQNIPLWQDAAVRDLAAGMRSPLFIVTPDATRLDDIATDTVRLIAGDACRLAAAATHLLDASAPAVADLGAPMQAQAARIARALREASRPLIVTGTGAGSEALLEASASLASALRRLGRQARVALIVPECNSVGLALLGGLPLSEAIAAMRGGRVHTALILENDLYRRGGRDQVDQALRATRHVVVLDHTLHATARQAELLLPAATFAESSGTLINYEGRSQRYFPVLFPDNEITASWRWLNDACCASRAEAQPWRGLDDAIAALCAALPALAPIRAAAPPADFRIAASRIASAPHRQSGRTAQYADVTVHEPPPPPNLDAPFSNSMEGYYGVMPAALYPFFWTPAWNSEQGLNKFQQEVGGPLRGGEAGVRLFAFATEPLTTPRTASPAQLPAPFIPREGEWLLIAQQHVFGSEELSVRTPALAERIMAPALGLCPADAARLHVGAGQTVTIELPGWQQPLPVQIRPALPSGVATLTIGLPAQPWVQLPAWSPVHPVQS